MKKTIWNALMTIFMFAIATGLAPEVVMAADAGQQNGDEALTSIDQLDEARIGTQTGAMFDQIIKERFPDAKMSYYNSISDLIAALESDKIDGFPLDEPVLRGIMSENDRLTRLPENLDTFQYAYAFKKDEAGKNLCDEMSDFIKEMAKSGEMEKLQEEWLENYGKNGQLPDTSDLKAEKGTLVMATEASYVPFSFLRDNKIVGYEIELAWLFCQKMGYGLEIKNMNFDGILPAVQSGKADFAAATIGITEERAQSVNFSEPDYSGSIVMAILKSRAGGQDGGQSGDGSQSVPEYTEFSDLKGKTVSMLTGAPLEDLVRSKEPDVAEFTYYNNMADVILALKSEKTDAVLSNNAVGQLSVNRNPELAMFPKNLEDSAFGIAFDKDSPEKDDWQAAYEAIPQEEIEAAWEKWTGADESAKVLPEQDWPGNNGQVTVAACDSLEPLSYAGQDGEIKGFDIEILLKMAKNMDVHVDFVGMEFSAVMTYVQSGKALMGVGSIIVTDERKESCDFVEYYPAAFVLVVRAVSKQEEAPTFVDQIQSGIEKTFIREDRWKLFIDGVITTLIITVLSILFGTILGFIVFMLCRNGNPLANGITRFCLWLVQGMPMVVLLMILYYIIFGKVAINGVVVAVIGFTITFGASVFGLMKMGVGAVEEGQYEAAYALGYGNTRTFFRFILPQALPHILPVYKGEIVSLIKASAIIGYIAVQDLTKVGDLIRSRTYDAFFPLIAITIIYFVLEWLISFLVSRIEINIDPRKRTPEQILEGVRRDD